MTKQKTLKTIPRSFDTTDISQNFEGFETLSDEWIDIEENDEDDEENSKKVKVYIQDDIPLMKQEKIDLERFRDLAKAIFTNSKGDALLIALEKALS